MSPTSPPLPAPPRTARWMLDHLIPKESDALAGDLLEAFHAGRSRSWFWRQTFSAILQAWIRSLYDRRFMLFFAAAWAMLGPAWSLTVIRFQNDHNFGRFVWRMPWPWSTVADMALTILLGVAFIWLGCLIYLLAFASPHTHVTTRRMARMLGASLAAFVLTWAVALTFLLVSPPVQPHNYNYIDWRTLTLAGVITNIRVWPLPTRLPDLVVTAIALWGFARKTESPAPVVS